MLPDTLNTLFAPTALEQQTASARRGSIIKGL
jgi:hypothetical protein